MATSDRERWDAQHAAEQGSNEPAAFLKWIFEQRSWDLPRGKALDVATGKGRNAIFLARLGFDVEAIDISQVALDEARRRAADESLTIEFRQTEIDTVELGESRYDLIVNFNFLDRSLVPRMKRAIKRGGHIIFETYLIDQQALGHPRNPAYLLGHKELLELFRDFRALFYREGKFLDGQREAYRAGLLAQQPG